MGSMDRDEEYDWVDDETLDFDSTLRRFEQLKPVRVTLSRQPYGFVTATTTSADHPATTVKPQLGPQRQAANFA